MRNWATNSAGGTRVASEPLRCPTQRATGPCIARSVQANRMSHGTTARNERSEVWRSSHDPASPPRSDGHARTVARRRSSEMTFRYAKTDETLPGHTAMVFVALAVTDPMPVVRRAGNETSDPPPAIALMTPAAKPAAASRAHVNTPAQSNLARAAARPSGARRPRAAGTRRRYTGGPEIADATLD